MPPPLAGGSTGPALPAPVAVAVLPLLTLGLLAFWVYRHATARWSGHPVGWAAGAVVSLGALALLYLVARDGVGARSSPPTRGERAATTGLVAILS